jgi:hypothetical protein
MELGEGKLKPVLLICAYINPETNTLNFQIFDSVDTIISDFVDFLLFFDIKKGEYRFDNYICMAHNLQGFDGPFIVKEMYNRPHYAIDKIIYNGTKLQMMHISRVNLTFLDSFNFVHTSLRGLSKMFGIDERKTFFPYKFVTPKTLHWRGILPPIDWYEPNHMKEDDRLDFFKFYEQQKEKYKHKIFVLKDVMREYCKQDVKVLARCMEEFRKLIYEKTSFDPFEHDLTLAGICLRDFIYNHLKPHTIGVIPAKGYFTCSNQSYKAFDYLNFQNYLLKTDIQTAKHPLGEYTLGQYKLDGICHREKIVFDFHGCYFHGCQTCFNFIDYSDNNGRVLMKSLYENEG